MELTPIKYNALNARQKENYNYQKIGAILADYGFVTVRLSDDWGGADFLAIHIKGETLKVQLKGRLTFAEKYRGKDLWICFPDQSEWYLYPHDELLSVVLDGSAIAASHSWRVEGEYSMGRLSRKVSGYLETHRITKASPK